MRGRALLLAVVAVVAVLGPAAGFASAGQAVGVEYRGSFTYRIDDRGPRGSTQQTRTLSWVMTIFDDGRSQRSHFLAQGTATTVFEDGSGFSCTIRQRRDAIAGPFSLAPGKDARHVTVGTYVPTDVGGDLAVSGGSCEGLSNVAHGVLFSIPDRDGALGTGNPCWTFDRAPQFVNPRLDRDLRVDSTRRIDREQTAIHVPGCQTNEDITATRTIHATLRVGAGGDATSDPSRAGPTSADAQKAFATSDLLTSLLRAQLPCGYVALGAGSALWAVSAGLPGTAALVPASVLISAGAPLCVAYARRIADDVLIANDPPAGDIHVIAEPAATPSGAEAAAQLAPCDAQPADQQAFCAELRTAAGDEIAAAQRVAAVADALRATVFRETKARSLHKAAALARQERAGDRLVEQLRAAALAEDTTWRRIASLLSAAGLRGVFTVEQDAAAIATLLTQLDAEHVGEAAVRRLAASALVATPVDLLAT